VKRSETPAQQKTTTNKTTGDEAQHKYEEDTILIMFVR
jgi:hypothetical protein